MSRRRKGAINGRLVVYNVGQVIQNMMKYDRVVRTSYQQNVVVQVEAIKTESLMQVPRKTGNLASSVFLIINRTKDGVFCRIGYRASYALPVHEIGPDRAVHLTGKWKYLEDPIRKAQPGFDERVAMGVLADLEKKGRI